eukprot:COSAG01_NODE_2131_length_8361_cov_7.018276_9_plen_146_part_00
MSSWRGPSVSAKIKAPATPHELGGAAPPGKTLAPDLSLGAAAAAAVCTPSKSTRGPAVSLNLRLPGAASTPPPPSPLAAACLLAKRAATACAACRAAATCDAYSNPHPAKPHCHRKEHLVGPLQLSDRVSEPGQTALSLLGGRLA